jgi:hypothetical protein
MVKKDYIPIIKEIVDIRNKLWNNRRFINLMKTKPIFFQTIVKETLKVLENDIKNKSINIPIKTLYMTIFVDLVYISNLRDEDAGFDPYYLNLINNYSSKPSPAKLKIFVDEMYKQLKLSNISL